VPLPAARYLITLHFGDLSATQLGRFAVELDLGLKSPSEVMEIVARYYAANQLPARAQFAIEDILAEAGGEP
jgi:hypothetical protein